ncbi:adenylyl-sulfate kinase [Ensifer sp. BR816]|uniref:adenylyl-sulfate kinase n=1 Tax=Rhizobium sp. (strain BR816) TaxID=1057002 RepID=UPI0009FE61F9|nr:adenylyl-sulfate kinase [Ensifer sp. BR816]
MTYLAPEIRQENARLQAGTVLWLLGPTSAGKTTLATRVVADLRKNGIPAILFDGDEVRDFFGEQLGFGADSRLRVVSILVHLANKAADAGLNVVVAALTAGDDARAYVRQNAINLTIGYVACSIQGCAQRDPKGLYGKAMRGEINTLIGYNSAYQPPESPDLILDTELHSLDELTARIVASYAQD